MTDAMEVAKQRKKDYETQISKKKAEIEELEEMIGDLNSFMEFGNELLNGPAKAAAPTSRPSPQVKSQPSPQLKEVPNKPAAASAPKADDEWGDDDAQQSIARVLSARNG